MRADVLHERARDERVVLALAGGRRQAEDAKVGRKAGLIRDCLRARAAVRRCELDLRCRLIA